MSKYTRQRRSSQRMVRRFADGRTCELTYPAEQIGGDRFNPVYDDPVTVTDVPCVMLPRGGMNAEDFRMDTLLSETTHVAYIAGADVPDKKIVSGMQIESLGVTHNVLSCDTWAPSGLPILHVIQVKV